MHNEVSMAPPLSGQAGLKVSNTVQVLMAHLELPDLAALDFTF
jgi:hypothetical protein